MRKILLLFYCIVVAFIFTSCEKSDYSCDPTIDDWAKENLDEIRVMPLSAFYALPMEYQKASFRVFTPERRKELWLAKISQTLTLPWIDAEKEHLLALQSMLTHYADIIFVSSCSETTKDEFTIDMYRWQNYAVNTLGWSGDMLYSIIGNPNEIVLDNDNDIRMLGGLIDTVGPAKPNNNCQCMANHDGFMSDCSGNNDCVSMTSCTSTSYGCGSFWTQSCNGLCKPYS